MNSWWKVKRERLTLWFVQRMPEWLVYWCGIRMTASGTTGPYSDEVVPEARAMDMIRRWGKREGGDRAFKPKRARFLARATLTCVLAGSVLGCAGVALTADQKASIVKLQKEQQDLAEETQRALEFYEETRKKYEGILDKYNETTEAIAKVAEDIKNKKVPVESGMALAAELQAKAAQLKADLAGAKTDFQAGKERYDSLVKEGAEVAAQIKTVYDDGVPWYVIAGSVGLNVLGLLTGAGVFQKMGTMGRVIGVLSRAGTALAKEHAMVKHRSPDGSMEAVLVSEPKGFAEAIEADLDSGGTDTRGVTKAVLRKYETKAKGG